MALKVSKMDVWVSSLADKPGALARKLAALADARANLQFVLARRTGKKGKGVVFVAPVSAAAARKAKLRKSRSIAALRVEGSDRAGAGACVTAALAEAGINLRGLSGAVIGKRFVLHIALDKAKDAAAARILRKL